jgi:hypothetical protein
MDSHQWVFSVNEEASRKRPWDIISTSTSAEANRPRSLVSGFPDEREASHSPEWKRRRSIVQFEPTPTWNTSMQTSLWLAQQNNFESNSSMREPNSQAPQVRRSEAEPRNRHLGLPEPSREWSRYADDVSKGANDDRSSGAQAPSTLDKPSKFSSTEKVAKLEAPKC